MSLDKQTNKKPESCCLYIATWLGITVPILALVGYLLLFLLQPEDGLLNMVMAVLVFTSHSINTSLHLTLLISQLIGRNLM